MLGSDSEEATKKVLPVLNTFSQKAVLLRKCVFSILDHNPFSTIAFQLGTFDWTCWRAVFTQISQGRFHCEPAGDWRVKFMSIHQTFQTPILLGNTAHAGITAHAADSRYPRNVHLSLEHTGGGLKWSATVALPGRLYSWRWTYLQVSLRLNYP